MSLEERIDASTSQVRRTTVLELGHNYWIRKNATPYVI